jgi:hypothetical protein
MNRMLVHHPHQVKRHPSDYGRSAPVTAGDFAPALLLFGMELPEMRLPATPPLKHVP